MNILVTGSAGFIGFHLCKKLISEGYHVIGLDNINGYYDINLKLQRLKELGITNIVENELTTSNLYGDSMRFVKTCLEDTENLPKLFKNIKIDIVINLAAQAGVRYSIKNPMPYVESNIVGFVNLLECMKKFNVTKLIFASSSSVYGNNSKVPFNEQDPVDEPISLYAASKKANELIAHSYSHLFKIQSIGLRFFTVYGPWGRPDMAMFLFTDAILKGKAIDVYNGGNLSRDFTYIDDIVHGVYAIAKEMIENRYLTRYKIYNIGNSKPVALLDFISAIEKATGLVAEKNMMKMQEGDVEKTWADISNLQVDFNYQPSTNIETGVNNFIKWYLEYFKNKEN